MSALMGLGGFGGFGGFVELITAWHAGVIPAAPTGSSTTPPRSAPSWRPSSSPPDHHVPPARE
ncbi:hypothetical protein J4573_32205 [Actinomadura barringtoniae]|uniref:Uncharacterized protein n=1 Tax=Actinomadura barringtoniae TaxID=1427535 RepID=A0A939PMC1_9ACTN|nr:hypothetical protein [Actinomadura barringtoniae]MBO2451789.1 hypothetical protein [Actinomadura barringtoniae]